MQSGTPQYLEQRIDIRHSDYRAVTESGFDRVASIGLTEHIGKKNYPAYFSFLREKLVDGGRLLNHCITRTDPTERTYTRNGFINRYVFPDGELVHVGVLIDATERQALEVQHEENLRVHYALTLGHWLDNLEAHWDEAVAEVGLRKARVRGGFTWPLPSGVSRATGSSFTRCWPRAHPAQATTGFRFGYRLRGRHAAARGYTGRAVVVIARAWSSSPAAIAHVPRQPERNRTRRRRCCRTALPAAGRRLHRDRLVELQHRPHTLLWPRGAAGRRD